MHNGSTDERAPKQNGILPETANDNVGKDKHP